MRTDMGVLDFEYMRHFAAGIEALPLPVKMLALHLGAGACTMPRYLAHRYPESRHIAVDIDEALPELARTWWDLPRAPRLRIRAIDGLEFLQGRGDDSADLVIRDAFDPDVTPPHLAGDEFWSHARRVVRGGAALANVGVVPQRLAEAWRDAAHARAHFRHVVAVGEGAVLKGRRRGNVVIIAADAVDEQALRRYAASAALPTSVDATWGLRSAVQ